MQTEYWGSPRRNGDKFALIGFMSAFLCEGVKAVLLHCAFCGLELLLHSFRLRQRFQHFGHVVASVPKLE